MDSVGKIAQQILFWIPPNFLVFLSDFGFSCKFDIRSGYTVYGVGRYGIFPVPTFISNLELSKLWRLPKLALKTYLVHIIVYFLNAGFIFIQIFFSDYIQILAKTPSKGNKVTT